MKDTPRPYSKGSKIGDSENCLCLLSLGISPSYQKRIGGSWQSTLLLLVCGGRGPKFCFRKGWDREGPQLEYIVTSESLKHVLKGFALTCMYEPDLSTLYNF